MLALEKQIAKMDCMSNYAEVDLFGEALREEIVPIKPSGALGKLIREIDDLSFVQKVEILNLARSKLHEISPFRAEPVDCVTWVSAETVEANDYNPNSVAPPEMKLLETSIEQDGYTQPIVTFRSNGIREVVDGFHRNRVGRECAQIKERIRGYLPVVTITTGRGSG